MSATLKARLTVQDRTEISMLLAQRNRFGAIKYLCTELGMRLQEARRLVDVWEQPRPIPQSGATSRQPSHRRVPVCLVVAAVLTLAGGGMIGAACWTVHAQREFAKHAVVAQGRVVGMHAVGSAKAPILEYALDGTVRRWTSPFASNPSSYETGSELPVLVDANDPARITVDDFSHRWLLPIILGSLGIGFCLAAAGALVLYLTVERRNM